MMTRVSDSVWAITSVAWSDRRYQIDLADAPLRYSTSIHNASIWYRDLRRIMPHVSAVEIMFRDSLGGYYVPNSQR